MDSKRRIVVTGLGMVTPIGIGVSAFSHGLHACQSAIKGITRFDTSIYRSKLAGEVPNFDPETFFSGRQLRRLDRYAQFALAAAQLAVQDAALDLSAEDRGAVGVSIGSAIGGIGMAEEQYDVYAHDGLRAVSLTLGLSVYGGAANCNIAIDMGITGANLSNSNSCSSGTMAIGEAMYAVRSGRADVMLAGGSEAPLFPLTFGAFDIIKSMSCRNDEPEKACRPFDAGRDGFIMAEGSAVMVLEELGHAVRRGARIYAEVAGYACGNDAFHMTAPLPDGSQAARVMKLALGDAGASLEEIEYINAHGSSTPLNDKSETLAIKSVFGERAPRVPISSTKAMHGHSLGASGAIEASACVLAMYEGFIPPTINLESPDPDCDLDYVPLVERRQKVGVVMSNSFGFGGINSVLVFREIERGMVDG